MNIPAIENKTQSMLIGWAIGDALWVPYEFQSREYIQKHIWWIDEYLPAKSNMFFKKWWYDTPDSWVVSDDTMLTFVWVNSIIEKNKIDFDDIMNKSYDALIEFPPGFWRSTTQALKKYQQWIDITLTWSAGAISNGIMMKQAPYAAYFLSQKTSESEIENILKTLTYATHKVPETFATTLVHNFFLMQLLSWEKNIETIFQNTLVYAIEKEEQLFEWQSEIDFLFSDILKDIIENPQRSIEDILAIYGWWDNIWKCGYLKTTVWICYSLFIQKQNMDTLLESVNIGWDTDTYAAILWNMLWAYKWKFYEDKYEQWLQNRYNLLSKADTFTQTIFSRK